MTEQLLKILEPADLPRAVGRREAVDPEALAVARPILEDIQRRGEPALREHAERLGDIEPGAPLILSADELADARAEIDADELGLLERVAERVRRFAEAQLGSLGEVEIPVPGGMAGQNIAPVERAGCYAPGGRFPLPSSVLMTAVPARVAGVGEIWVASPRPATIARAAASVAGVDGLVVAGGAQAVAALACGAGLIPACDVVVGPGNRFVAAAKQLVFGQVGIDMIAGPSELAILADGTADPGTIAADLLAQAEHDPFAEPFLITTSPALADTVNEELARQLALLPTARIARAALGNGFAVLVSDLEAGAAICDRLAPEHLELMVEDAASVVPKLRHYGALFIGEGAAEVLGDYGAGPNHTLPTGRSARYTGGLSVFDFLRIRTWLRIDDEVAAAELISDAERLAGLEGLIGHVRSARRRRKPTR